MADIKNGIGGAAGGAATGAALGSLVAPGIGTAIGAVGGGILSGLGGLFGGADDSATLAQLQANQQLYSGLQTPNMQWQNFNPEQYSYQGNFDPTMAQASLTQDNPNDVSAEQTALNQMAGLAQSGMSDQDAAAFDQAKRQADQDANSGTQAAIQNAQARGVGGGGMAYALGEQARQSAADRESQANLQQAATAAQQRALYQQAYLGGLQNERGADYQTSSNNANILNQFNQANTQAQNTYGYNNNQNRQNISNQNVALNNNASMYNQQGNIGLQQQNFQNQLNKVQGQAGANSGMAQGTAAQSAANQNQWNSNMGTAMSGIGTLASQQNNQNLVNALTKKGTTNGTATAGSGIDTSGLA